MATPADIEKIYLDNKKRRARKIKVIAITAITVIAVLTVAVVSRHIENSPNQSAIEFLQQIRLAEIAAQPDCCGGAPCPSDSYRYIFTDGVSETAEAAVLKLVQFGFHPDPSIAFHIMPRAAANGNFPPHSYGFIAFAAHNSAGSTVFVFDSTSGRDWNATMLEAHAHEVYGVVTVTGSMLELFRYLYDASHSGAPVV